MSKILFWLTRILSILLIAFVSVFALDVFSEPGWFLALLIHLIPSFILIVFTIFAWKYERVGGILFLALGLFLIFFTAAKSYILYIPVFLLGILFITRSCLPKKDLH